MQVNVNSTHPYQVIITSGALSELPSCLLKANQAAVIYSPRLAEVANRVSKIISDSGIKPTLIEVPDSEKAKTSKCLLDCWSLLAKARFTRNDRIIGLGGGATTDLAGFIASTWLRGVGYIAVPTTVLSMVDAAVGGKTGINLNEGKNLVGTFYEPLKVICDVDLLTDLPSREISSGLAEIIKCGFIKDPKILNLIAQEPTESQDVTSVRFGDLVRRAVQVKAEIVAADLYESTSKPNDIGREMLNYGHTLGHAIEADQNYELRHGEAISIGMIWAAEISKQLIGLDNNIVELHRQLLASVKLPITLSGSSFKDLREIMRVDKKSRGQTLRLIGISKIGQVKLLTNPDEKVLLRCFQTIAKNKSITKLRTS